METGTEWLRSLPKSTEATKGISGLLLWQSNARVCTQNKHVFLQVCDLAPYITVKNEVNNILQPFT